MKRKIVLFALVVLHVAIAFAIPERDVESAEESSEYEDEAPPPPKKQKSASPDDFDSWVRSEYKVPEKYVKLSREASDDDGYVNKHKGGNEKGYDIFESGGSKDKDKYEYSVEEAFGTREEGKDAAHPTKIEGRSFKKTKSSPSSGNNKSKKGYSQKKTYDRPDHGKNADDYYDEEGANSDLVGAIVPFLGAFKDKVVEKSATDDLDGAASDSFASFLPFGSFKDLAADKNPLPFSQNFGHETATVKSLLPFGLESRIKEKVTEKPRVKPRSAKISKKNKSKKAKKSEAYQVTEKYEDGIPENITQPDYHHSAPLPPASQPPAPTQPDAVDYEQTPPLDPGEGFFDGYESYVFHSPVVFNSPAAPNVLASTPAAAVAPAPLRLAVAPQDEPSPAPRIAFRTTPRAAPRVVLRVVPTSPSSTTSTSTTRRPSRITRTRAPLLEARTLPPKRSVQRSRSSSDVKKPAKKSAPIRVEEEEDDYNNEYDYPALEQEQKEPDQEDQEETEEDGNGENDDEEEAEEDGNGENDDEEEEDGNVENDEEEDDPPSKVEQAEYEEDDVPEPDYVEPSDDQEPDDYPEPEDRSYKENDDEDYSEPKPKKSKKSNKSGKSKSSKSKGKGKGKSKSKKEDKEIKGRRFDDNHYGRDSDEDLADLARKYGSFNYDDFGSPKEDLKLAKPKKKKSSNSSSKKNSSKKDKKEKKEKKRRSKNRRNKSDNESEEDDDDDSDGQYSNRNEEHKEHYIFASEADRDATY